MCHRSAVCDGVSVTTPEGLEAAQSCRAIDGDLTISGQSWIEVAEFECLEKVTGITVVSGNESLRRVGLPLLESTAALLVGENQALEEFDAPILSHASAVYVVGNPVLVDVPRLSVVWRWVSVVENASLCQSDLDGWISGMVTAPDAYLALWGNDDGC